MPAPSSIAHGRLRSFFRDFGTFLLPVGILLVGAGLSVCAGRQDLGHQRIQERAELTLQLSAVGARMESQIRTAFSESEGIAQLLSVDGEISTTHFHAMVEQTMAAVPYIHHIVMAPDDIVADAYPLHGNEPVLGLDYRDLPAQYPMLQRARALGQGILVGPLELFQGGRGLVYRKPVFLPGHKGVSQYWGSLAVVANIDDLLQAAGLNADADLRVALRGRDGRGSQGEMIAGDPLIFAADPVLYSVTVPGGTWQLAALPRDGWARNQLFDSTLFLLSLGATLLSTLFAAQLSRGHRLIQKRNNELSMEIAEREHAQAELQHLAHYDEVTGLPNRLQFNQHLTQGIERCQHGRTQMAVLVLDVDGFKLINDSLGHAMGDLLLQQATWRFAGNLRAGDTVARLGGDEFAFLLNDLHDSADAVRVVRKLLQVLQRPFDLNGNAALVTASIGIALCPADGRCAEELLRHADTAMYSAKEAGRNDFRFYQPAMTWDIQRRLGLEHALRRALECEEFEVWYQPKIDLFSGSLSGAEALLRWRDPIKGLIMPNDFIPLAERSGLIIPIGEWLLHQVCRQLRRWREHGRFAHRVAINVAAPQIERTDFVATVRDALARFEVPAQCLEVEVTESLIMDSQGSARDVLQRLRNLGVSTALDDFGTGYSSLAYLKMLPIDNLKIDRSFVSDLPGDATQVAIAQAIIDLGRALNFSITAEGVETGDQLEFLRRAGCDAAQGYLIGKPMPVAEFEAWMERATETL